MDELTDFQVSAPMPARSEARIASDREITEELRTSTARRGGQPRKALERTQPISFATAAAPAPSADPGCRAVVPDPLRTAGERDPAAREPLVSRRADLVPGDVLCGRYVVEAKVAHWGMGHVYKALDRRRESAGAGVPWVALKFPRTSVGSGGETTTLLRQEFLKLSQLRHPNIVSVFDIASHDGLEFIVMEWLSGETLADLLARITTKRVALDKATDIVRSTARALAHAHDLGIVHGDVKPSNIFLARGRIVKVLDFGSSGTSSGTGDGERHWATRAYASSDVLQGRPPQPHDDVFALGVTAYGLLSGERPFGDLDALAARDRNVRPAPLPDDALEQWPAVRHALAFAAIDRPGNARLFLQELDEVPAEVSGRHVVRHSPTVVYGAVAATVLASLVWWSVQSVGGLPPDGELALAGADRALAEGRLVEPEGESAFALYSAILETEPGNRLALDGLEKIAEHFLRRARAAVLVNDAPAAAAHVAMARKVSPGHFGIAMVEDLIASRGRDALLRARQAAATDTLQAEALLAEAESLLPASYAGLGSVRDEIAAQRRANRVGELLREIEQRILSERLSVPTGDSALDLLRQARELAPDDGRIPLAADRVLTALLFQAMFATSNGDLREAENFLSMARGMGIRHLALARTEYELARARRAALAAGKSGGD